MPFCTEAVLQLLRFNNRNQECYKDIDVFLDLEHLSPTIEEIPNYEISEKVLQEAQRALTDFESYGQGALADIQEAYRHPNNEKIQEKCATALKAVYKRAKYYFEVANTIKQIVPVLLFEICGGPLPPADAIDRAQALSLQFARIIDFAHRFDCVRLNTPEIVNDLSFYKRLMTKADHESQSDGHQVNQVHLFIAEGFPMMKTLIGVTADFVDCSQIGVANITDTLTAFVYISRHMLDRKSNSDRISPETQEFFARVMVGAFILFDHTDENGGFCRNSPIDIRGIIELVKRHEKISGELVSALKHITKHLKDSGTSKAIKSLFDY